MICIHHDLFNPSNGAVCIERVVAKSQNIADDVLLNLDNSKISVWIADECRKEQAESLFLKGKRSRELPCQAQHRVPVFRFGSSKCEI